MKEIILLKTMWVFLHNSRMNKESRARNQNNALKRTTRNKILLPESVLLKSDSITIYAVLRGAIQEVSFDRIQCRGELGPSKKKKKRPITRSFKPNPNPNGSDRNFFFFQNILGRRCARNRARASLPPLKRSKF